MPSLPSSNTWQSIPSTLPPPNRPAACTFAHEAHHCQKQPRSFLEDCLLRLLAWHSCIFLLVHRWNMRHLCILNATNECWNMGKVPVGLPHRPEWVRSFEITGRTKSHGGTRGTNGGWLCFIWNLWEINGNQRYQPSKMEHAQRSAFGRPEPWIALKLHQDKWCSCL